MTHRTTVLIVDDNEINRSILADILCGQYDILEACNGTEAVSILSRQNADISLVLLDAVMPEMNGFEVLEVMNRNKWIQSVPVIMISAENSSSFIDNAYELGATDYITRPFDEKAVLRRVQNTIMLYTKQQMLEDMVAEQVMEREHANSQMVEVLSNIVEFRNGESGLHVIHIRVITNILLQSVRHRAPQYELTPSKIILIANASSMHDIGKICIDEKILNKPGRLTPEEFEIMKTHSAVGAQMLENACSTEVSELLLTARDICRWHHERYDGRGYPDGLKGDEIPISAQVVALADVYDALTSKRVYKPAFTHEKAIEMITGGQCGAFNPILLECLLENSERLRTELADVNSAGMLDEEKLPSLADELMLANDTKISNRTFRLLEQERMKYEFYASMTRDILFEYNMESGVLEFSEWGAQYMNIPQVINKSAVESTLSPMAQECYRDLLEEIKTVTLANPMVSKEYCLRFKGEPHWFMVVVRPLWEIEEEAIYTRVIGKMVDVHQQHMHMLEMRRTSRDPLTMLLNLRTAREMIDEKLNRRQEETYAMVLMDVDQFKQINEKGRERGDHVLKAIAAALSGKTRVNDIVSRIGGDEYMLFLEYRGEADKLAKRVCGLCADVCAAEGISLSAGFALCPNDSVDFDKLFQQADIALYHCKTGGGDGYRFYDSSMSGYILALSQVDAVEEN